jgi:DNA-binding IclR family transcriptional regulator
MSQWSFLTNHAHVLLCIAHDPNTRLRDIAESVGITERAAHRIVAELVEEGFVSRERVGRRNRYEVHPERRFDHPTLTHPAMRERTMAEVLSVFLVPNGQAVTRSDTPVS